MSLRYEVTDAPGTGSTTSWQDRVRIADLQPVSASFTDYRRQVGRGQLVLPNGYERLAEVIDVDSADHSNDVASLVRVWRPAEGSYPETLVAEWLVNQTPDELTEFELIVNGAGVEQTMDWATVWPWDYNDSGWPFLSTVPDHIYGGRNLIPPLGLGDLNSIREEWSLYLSGERYELDVSLATSGDFTLTVLGDTTAAIDWDASAAAIKSALEALASVTTVSVLQPDPDTREWYVVFENPKDLASNMTANFGGLSVAGTLTKLNDGFDTGTNPTFTVTVDGDTTNALDWDATTDQIEGSPLTGNGLEGLAGINDVTVSGSGIASDPWLITFFAPPDPTNVTVTFAAGTAVFDKLVEGDPDPSPVTVSKTFDGGINAGIHGCGPDISVVTSPVDTGADWSLLVEAECRFDGSQIVLPVTPGQLYQASIRIRPTVTGLYTLVIRDEFENLIKNPSPRDNLLTAGSFQTISVPDIQIPPGVTRIIMRVAVTDPDPANIADFYVNWQGAEFNEGMQAATVGQIMIDLLDDAQSDHAGRNALLFINADFDATNDTSGTAWPRDESVNIQRGQTYRRVLDSVFGRLGYEWDLEPSTNAGEWDLRIWQQGTRGTDHTTADSPAMLIGQGTRRASASTALPRGNAVTVEGAAQQFYHDEESGSITAIGRREAYEGDITYVENLDEWATQILARFMDEGYAPNFDVVDGPWPVPGVAYDLADTMTVTTGVRRVSRQVESRGFSETDADGLVWTVQYGQAQFGGPVTSGVSSGFSGGLGAVGPVAEGVRRLIEKLDRLPDPSDPSTFLGGGKGGTPTVVLAASDASDISKGKADLICSGGNDATAFQAALDMLPTSPREMGRLVLTEGTFYINTSLNTDIFEVGSNRHIQGMGRLNTRIYMSADALSTNRVLFDLRDGSIISDLSIERDPAHSLGANSYTAVGLFGARCGLRNIDILEVGAMGGTAQSSVWSGNSQPNQFIVGCYIASPEVGVYANTPTELIVANNWFQTDALDALIIDGGSECLVSNNWLTANETAVLLDTVSNSAVVGNVIEAPGEHGIELVTADDNLIQGNRIIDPTSDGIRVGGDGNYVTANFVSAASAVHGINVTGGTANAYVGNRASGTYSTAAYADAGTSSVNTWPGAAAPQGDNLT